MADTGSGGGQPPKEMSMEKRLLMAVILMGVVMFTMPYLFRAFGPPPATTQKSAGQPTAAEKSKTAEPAVPAAPAAPPEAAVAAAPAVLPANATPQTPAPPVVIDTSLYRIVLNNQGATVRSWQLKRFKGNDGKPLELVNTAAGLEYPLSVYIPGQDALAKSVNWAYYKQEPDPDGLGATFTFSDGRTSVRKTLRFQSNSYISHLKVEVATAGKTVPAMVAWLGGFGDFTINNPANAGRALYFNVSDNKLVEENSGTAKNGPVSSSGNYSFAGIADNYFAAVFLPENPATVRQTVFSNSVKTPYEKQKAVPFVGVAVSDGGSNDFEVFVGPKDLDQLKRINPKLEQLVSFGWWSFLAKPLFLITNWLNDRYVHNFGWAIVVVTVIINFILFPLKLSSFKSMKKMSALKPQIDAINEKYKSISIRDPRKADQNQEMMDLYKKNGVNPMGGCFPMLLQLPFFFAFYKVFNVSAEMRGATWLWVTDLSQPEHLPIKILPLAMIASQILMQKMTPQTTMDPKQQRMMYLMPLALGFMFYYFPSGLVLYYLTSNLVGLGQQWFFNKTAAPSLATVAVAQPKKKNVRK